MTVAVLVPLATDCPDRLSAWAWIHNRYRTLRPDWDIYTGTTESSWSKALAVTDAISKTDADVLVIADADAWCDQTPEYVDQVANGAYRWATPHRRIVRLNPEGTRLLYRGELDLTVHQPRRLLDQAEYTATLGGGIVIVTRDLYEQVPLDPRFEGWGGEDESWGRALATITGRRARLHGDHVLWHCWHPPQERMNRRMGTEANAALTERYRQAAGDPEATLRLIEEGRCHSRTSSSSP